MRDGIPENELRSCKLQNGPITIDVATGISVNATGEWGCALPLLDGTHQLVRGLTVPKVTSDMPLMKLRPVLDDIKSGQAENKELQKIQIPELLGGQVDMILGIQFSSVYPEPVHYLANGLTVFKSKFLPSKPGEIACIGGPVECIHNIASSAGATFTVRYLTNFLSRVSTGYTPKFDFFPSSDAEMERKVNIFADKGIPQLEEYFDNENEDSKSQINDDDIQTDEETIDSNDEIQTDEETIDSNDEIQIDEEAVDFKDDIFYDKITSENLLQETFDRNEVENEKPNNEYDSTSKNGEVLNVDICVDCGDAVLRNNKSMTVQAELRKFFEQQGSWSGCHLSMS